MSSLFVVLASTITAITYVMLQNESNIIVFNSEKIDKFMDKHKSIHELPYEDKEIDAQEASRIIFSTMVQNDDSTSFNPTNMLNSFLCFYLKQLSIKTDNSIKGIKIKYKLINNGFELKLNKTYKGIGLYLKPNDFSQNIQYSLKKSSFLRVTKERSSEVDPNFFGSDIKVVPTQIKIEFNFFGSEIQVVSNGTDTEKLVLNEYNGTISQNTYSVADDNNAELCYGHKLNNDERGMFPYEISALSPAQDQDDTPMAWNIKLNEVTHDPWKWEDYETHSDSGLKRYYLQVPLWGGDYPGIQEKCANSDR